jgi:hypothetical protein
MLKEQPDWQWFWGGVIKSPFGRVKWKLQSRYQARQYFKLLKGLKIKTALELGGCSGYLARIVAGRIGFSLTIVDSNSQAKEVWQKISGKGDYILEDFFKFQTKRKWDLVFSDGVLEHFFEKKKRIEFIKIHARLSRRCVIIFVPRNSFWVRNFAHLSEDLGYEKLYTFDELEKEVGEAGLIPIKKTGNYHEIGILAKKR